MGNFAGLLQRQVRLAAILSVKGSASLCVELGRCCMRGRETASGRMEKSAVLAPVPKQKVSIVEREGPGRTVWLDSQGDGDCPICGTGLNSRHGSCVRPRRDLPAQGISVLIQATRRVAGSPHAPRFTCHKIMWCDRHAQAGQRPSSTQSEAEPI